MKRTMMLGWLGALTCCLVAACGSEEGEGLACGAGTVESGGECVPSGTSDGGVDGSAGSAGAAGTGGTGGAGGTASTVPCEESGHCPTVEMVKITDWPEGVDGAPFEIDSHETTNAEYAVFLQDVEDGLVAPQTDARCGWNEEFGQDTACQEEIQLKTYLWEVGAPEFPAVCLDWCDAAQYCAWAGKRLCRTDSWRLTPEEELDETQMEWLLACSGGENTTGQRPSEYKEKDCQWDSPCEDYPGVFNLAGGVGEWVDRCGTRDDSDVEKCSALGDRDPLADCTTNQLLPVSKTGIVGIRCCR